MYYSPSTFPPKPRGSGEQVDQGIRRGRRGPSVERSFTLQQADQLRSDLYAIGDELDFIKDRLARLPTRGDLAKTALGIILSTATLVVL